MIFFISILLCKDFEMHKRFCKPYAASVKLWPPFRMQQSALLQAEYSKTPLSISSFLVHVCKATEQFLPREKISSIMVYILS